MKKSPVTGGLQRNLGIGEIIITRKNEEIIWTVLGSCVSVIFHVDNVVSMICHAQLPYNSINRKCTNECPHPCGRDFDRSSDNLYVKCSLEYMIKELSAFKFDKKDLHTTLIGGASVFNIKTDLMPIGELNVKAAKDILKEKNIRINREKTGGLNGCNLWYNTSSNRLLYKVINEDSQRIELLNNTFIKN
ncbi:MAG: chemotaxis protein CheD [Spirochaetes bacterium]|nr:chemotaxis protein CheD [Spirochaetota bacterium]